MLFISWTIAQDIGHLGVDADPTPLIQAKRPMRRLALRNTNRNSNVAAVKADPLAGASKDLRADVTDVTGASGKDPKANSTAPTSGSTTVAVTSAPPPPKPEIRPDPKSGAKPSAPSAEDYIARAEELAAKSDPSGAADVFRLALSLKPDSIDAQLGLADSLHDAKNFQGADAQYAKIIAQNQNSVEAHRGRGDTLYELKRYDEAVGEYQEAIRFGANDAGVLNNLANAYFRTGTRENRDRAIESYRKAIDKEPNWPDAYAGLANVLRVQKRLTEAQQAIEKSLQLSPNSALAHSVAGRIYADLNNFARANAEGQKAIDLAPKGETSFLSFAYLNLGGILYAQRRFDEAIRAYVTAQSYDRTWAVPRNSLGNLYLAANRPLEAAEEFEAAAKLEPKSSAIRTNLGNAYAILQKYDAAISNFRLAAQLDPKNPNPHSNMGLTLLRQGRFNEAVNAFSEALKIEPNNPIFQQAYADSLKLAGRGKEAKDVKKDKKEKEKKKN
ncbi:MAG TPA: tetratricopeptide repeat protein [Blastocatellia bacterium]|nr:tetratricopeptide repeat protein [Blastocatellia bacterium]